MDEQQTIPTVGMTSGHARGDRKFCPDAGLVPRGGHDVGVAIVLRMLLRPLVALMAIATTAFLVRDLALGTEHVGVVCFGATGLLIALTVLLFSSRELELRALRLIELAAFAAVAADLLVEHAEQIVAAAAAGDAGLVLAAWNMSVLSFVLSITAYAVFVPNTWQRAALLVVPLAAAPVALGAWLRATDVRVAALAGEVLDARTLTDVVLIMLELEAALEAALIDAPWTAAHAEQWWRLHQPATLAAPLQRAS